MMTDAENMADDESAAKADGARATSGGGDPEALPEIPLHIAKVLEHIPDGFVMIDDHDCYVYVNAQGERLLRKSREDLLGKSVWQIFPAAVDTPFEDALRHVRSTGQPTTCRDYIASYGIWLDSNLIPGPAALLCYFRDVTAEQIATERTAQFVSLTTALASAITLDEVAKVVVEFALSAFDAAAGHVFVLSEGGHALRALGVVGYDEATMEKWREIPLDAPVPLVDAVRARTPIFLGSFEERQERYPAIGGVTPLGSDGALAALPLLMSDRAIGVVGLRFPSDRSFSDGEREYMLTMAGQCALALERARLYDSERRLRDHEHLHYLRTSQVEQALVLNEERFGFAIDAAEIGIWHRSFATNEHVWSTRCRQLYGIGPDAEVSYDLFLSVLHPDDHDRVDRAFRYAILNGTTYEEEYRVVWPDGSVHWVYSKGHGYYDDSGDPVRYEGIALGIDERKRIESALRDSEMHLRLALQNGRLGSWDVDLATETLIHISDICKANYGIPPDAALDYGDLFTAVHPDDRVRVRSAFEHALRFRVDYHAEYRCIWPDGTTHWIFAHGRPMFDDEGRPERMIGVTQDITDRKRTEVELSALYAREHRIAATLQRSLQSMPEPADIPVDLTSLYEPASSEADVGGDFIDAFNLADGRVALVVGDVVGKGLKAASRTAEIKYSLRAFMHIDPDPAAAMSMLNTFLCRTQRTDTRDADMLAALALAVLDPHDGRIEMTLAGLEPPLIVRADGTPVEVDCRGLPLCVSEDSAYETHSETLGAGDVVIMASDGITEARSGREFLGYEGLIKLALAPGLCAPLTAIAFSILEGAKNFAGGALHDDACLLLARRWSAS